MSGEPTSPNDPQDAEAAEMTTAQIDIDFAALIDLLSNHLYRDKSAVIRELLSNANDSLINRKREGGLAPEGAVIRIWLDPEAAQLVVKDNGIGMSKSDLMKYLATIGASLAREKSKEYGSIEKNFEAVIGKFGVGFLSSFIVAEKIEVLTRKTGGKGWRWVSRGSRDYQILPCEEAGEGTTVVLDLKPAARQDWTAEQIKKLVLENARHFVFPVFWGPRGQEKLNDLQAPWYAETPPRDEELEAFRPFLVRYRDQYASAANATEIIPLHAEGIRGVLYIPSPSALQQEQVGVVDLFCKRVFVTRDHGDIVPEEFRFVKGVVDCYSFRLNAARDDVQKDNLEYQRVREFLGRQVLERLRSLAQQAAQPTETPGVAGRAQLARLRLQTVLDNFHLLIKNALVQESAPGRYKWEDGYVVELSGMMPFRSSTGAVTTVPEYLKRRADAEGERGLLFLRPKEDATAILQLAQQRKREVILIDHPVEEQYLRRHAAILGISCRSAAETMPDEVPKLPVDGGWPYIVNYYQHQLSHPEFSLSVYLSEFEPETIFGRLLADTRSEGRRRLEEMVKDLEQSETISKDDPLFLELARVRQKRPHLLYLNKKNPCLRRLAEMLLEGKLLDLDAVLHPIFHDIALAAGHPLHESHMADYQAIIYREALEGMVAKRQTQNLETQLRDERRRVKETQGQIDALEKKLADLQQETTRSQGTANQVFFIRPMKDGPDDIISRKARLICERLGLQFIDPKQLAVPGNILSEITTYLRSSRFVLADVSEINNANVYYEAGFADGTSPQKLILIVEKSVRDERRLPFDFLTQRVIAYNHRDVAEFEEFLEKLENALKEMLSQKKA
jgi:HSP90 family molecular chaperone